MADPGRILKNVAPLDAPPARRVEAAVLAADARVRGLVAEAEAEVARRLEAARAEAEALLARATERGLAEGRARAAALVVAAGAARDRLLSEAGAEVVALALAVARTVLGREVLAGAAADVAAQALAGARERREVVLRHAPEDGEALRGAEPRLAGLLARARLELRADPEVPRGGAVVETEAGRLDARLETQLDALAAALREALP